MWFIPAITAILAGLAVALFTPVITAQTPPPSPVLVPCPTPAPAAAPRTVSIPGEVTLTSPGEPGIFRRPSDGANLTVFFGGGSGPASLTYDGAVLTARVPPLGAFEFLTGGDNC